MPSETDYGSQIDLERTIIEIEQRAVAALNSVLRGVTYEKARDYAPVRQIIQRTPRGDALKSIQIASGAKRSAIMRLYRNKGFRTQAAMDKFKASQPITRRINVPAPPAAQRASNLIEEEHQKFISENVPPKYQQEGHNNSFQPVIRSKGFIETGDFRRVHEGKLVPVAYATQKLGGRAKIVFPNLGDQSRISASVTSQARRDIETGIVGHRRITKSGRVSFMGRRGLHVAEGTLRYGGALRDSITVQEASSDSREGKGMIYGYVRAGGEGVDYAGYQEFGTGHNRPHPFLRPALYDSREPFKRAVTAIGEKVG